MSERERGAIHWGRTLGNYMTRKPTSNKGLRAFHFEREVFRVGVVTDLFSRMKMVQRRIQLRKELLKWSNGMRVW
jgi:hypothetical protein